MEAENGKKEVLLEIAEIAWFSEMIKLFFMMRLNLLLPASNFLFPLKSYVE